ncbi:MAG: antitoxin VbhA family protein [Endomicrobium sp.]|jgi:hypothetical protein|nr:antitoxin VbhA family protein [Endomicrobium sp.]
MPMTDFDEYIKQGEPDKKEKSYIWQTAIGLQQVDGLKPSAYLIETAKQNIEGYITFKEAKNRIDNYYKMLSDRKIKTGNGANVGINKNTLNKSKIINTKKLGVKR